MIVYASALVELRDATGPAVELSRGVAFEGGAITGWVEHSGRVGIPLDRVLWVFLGPTIESPEVFDRYG